MNDEYILYSTDFGVGEDGMVQYDIQNNSFLITKYPSNIKPEYHSYCKYKNCVYIINTDGTIIIFNIQNQTFQHIKNIKNKQSIGRYSSCINIEGSDEIHIFGGTENQYHLIYLIKTNQYIKKQNFGAKLENAAVIYSKYQKQFFVFSGYASNKFLIGTVLNNNNGIKWEISKKLEIPNTARDCGYILYKNIYIILFGGCGSNKQYLENVHAVNIQTGTIDKLNNIQCPIKDKYHAVFIENKIHLFGLRNDVKHYSLSIDKISNSFDFLEIKEQEVVEQKYNDEKPEIYHQQMNIIDIEEIDIEEIDIDEIDIDEIDEKEEEKKQCIEHIEHNEEINKLKKQIEHKDAKILLLEKENKMLKNENNELKSKILSYENTLNLSNYKRWDPNTIISWILSIENGLFHEYQSILLKTLSDDGIEGNDLCDINNHNDWKQYGILKYGHRKILIQYVNSLIHDNSLHPEGKKMTPHI